MKLKTWCYEYLKNKDKLKNPELVHRFILYKKECLEIRKKAVRRKKPTNFVFSTLETFGQKPVGYDIKLPAKKWIVTSRKKPNMQHTKRFSRRKLLVGVLLFVVLFVFIAFMYLLLADQVLLFALINEYLYNTVPCKRVTTKLTASQLFVDTCLTNASPTQPLDKNYLNFLSHVLIENDVF